MADIYKIFNTTVTIPSDMGMPVILPITLTNETYTLGTGVIKVGDVVVSGAAVILIETDDTSSVSSEKAISYTDLEGNFGIPFEPISGKTYSVKVYAPNVL